MTRPKPQWAIGGDRLRSCDSTRCQNCEQFARRPGMRYCYRCEQFMRVKIEAWAAHCNPIPGIDIREC